MRKIKFKNIAQKEKLSPKGKKGLQLLDGEDLAAAFGAGMGFIEDVPS